jgi:cell division transport system permease protein
MYALHQAMRAIRGNWVASVATITTMTLSLTILAGFSLLSLNLNQVLANLQSELEVSAFLAPGSDGPRLLETVRGWPEVARAEFVGRDRALAALIADIPSLATAAQLVDNPLPDALELRLLDPSQTPQVRVRLEQLPGVVDVEDGSDAVETFLAINDALRVVGSILIVVLLSSALFAIVNSIRAAITAREDEIEVQRLVGATRGFIRAPFLIEGFLLGLFSAVITLGLAIPGYQFVIARVADQLPFVPFVRDPLLLGQVALLLTALALLVGLGGERDLGLPAPAGEATEWRGRGAAGRQRARARCARVAGPLAALALVLVVALVRPPEPGRRSTAASSCGCSGDRRRGSAARVAAAGDRRDHARARRARRQLSEQIAERDRVAAASSRPGAPAHARSQLDVERLRPSATVPERMAGARGRPGGSWASGCGGCLINLHRSRTGRVAGVLARAESFHDLRVKQYYVGLLAQQDVAVVRDLDALLAIEAERRARGPLAELAARSDELASTRSRSRARGSSSPR